MSNKPAIGNLARLAILTPAIILVAYFGAVARADTTNVALGADVTLNGASFFTNGWGGGLTVDAGTVTDGFFYPRSTQWDQGPVWWDSTDLADRWVELDLVDSYRIESLIVQADDNDAYELYYWDAEAGAWSLLWDIPNYDSLGWGMQTRPNPADDTEAFDLAVPVVTTKFKFQGNMSNSDRLFAVAEIQAFGELVVAIDVKPCSDPNSINLRSNGVVPVAILTTDSFDATTVDPVTVEFAGAAPLRWTMEDVGSDCGANDGDQDLLFFFKTRELDLDGSSTAAELTGETFDGMPVWAYDTVKIVPSAK